ncbi:hypothetical protein J4E89_000848 [Alternaria sp. Ai002NY15]|nr:hypothetical protein J4E89_000848 [Alternaria sp. Ai002NY15]
MPLKSIPDALPKLRLMLNEERRNSFNFYTNTQGVRIERRAGIRPLYHAKRVDQYFTIVETGSDGSATRHDIVTRWKSVKGEPELDIQNPAIAEDMCISARSWLMKRYGGDVTHRSLLDEWFDRYHTSFRFMDLPRELRFLVFEASIGPVLWPDLRVAEVSETPRNAGRYAPDAAFASQHNQNNTPLDTSPEEAQSYINTWPRGLSINAPRLRDKVSCQHPQSNRPYGSTRTSTQWIKTLLLVSKTLSLEARKTIWETTTKKFGNMATLTRTIPHLSTHAFNTLRRVSLNYSDRAYLRLLGYKTTAELAFAQLPAEKANSLSVLTSINSIDYLDLHFQAPLPFQFFDDRMHSITQFKLDPVVNLCQKLWAEWFLTLLYERFAQGYAENGNVPMVSVSGDVKNSTRWEWEPVWRDFKHGIRRDFSSKAAEIKATPATQL